MPTKCMHLLYGKDIAKLIVDVVVNAAKPTLLGGGGVDGAIHRAAGPELLKECRLLGTRVAGEAVMTESYLMHNTKAIIHTVGPNVGNTGIPTEKDRINLGLCYKNSLGIAKENGFKSIAFPCISTGYYHFPKEEACEIALTTVRDWLADNPDAIEAVIFFVTSQDDERIYKKIAKKLV